MDIVRTLPEVRALCKTWREQGLTIGLVPTMGALHEGHMALVKAALADQCQRILVSIFVNPKQFGPTEDLASYPRQEAQDASLAAERGAHAIYAPSVSQMYPDGFSTTVQVDGLTDVLCGASRPGHFAGVTTVVSKLLNQVQADRAYFGEKDFQQLAVIRRLVSDLDMTTQICGVPIVRNPDHLALSSRNAYLSDQERIIAPHLNQALRRVAQAFLSNQDVQDACDEAKNYLLSQGFQKIDYLEVRRASDLTLITKPDQADTEACRVFGAAFLGRTRLIDNIPVRS